MAAGNAVGGHCTLLNRQFFCAGLFVGIRNARGCGIALDCAGNASISRPGIVGRVCSWRLIMKAIFALLFYLLLLPLGFAHEHTMSYWRSTGSFSTIFSDRTTILMSVSTRSPNHAAQTRMP
jgi:hypothetical protein